MYRCSICSWHCGSCSLPSSRVGACVSAPRFARRLSHLPAPVCTCTGAQAADLLHKYKSQPHSVRTPLPMLDAVLGDGFAFGSLTELAGTSGAGKSQWCMSTALSVLLAPGHEATEVVYIETERKLSPQLLERMAMARLAADGVADAGAAAASALRRLHILTATDAPAFLGVLSTLEGMVLQSDVALVVVDSIAGAVKADEGHVARQEALMAAATALKTLAEHFAFAVLVTNLAHTRAGGELSPSLGVAWSHAVNTRLLLDTTGSNREVVVAKCPSAPRVRLPFAITRAGVMMPTEATSRGFAAS